MEPGRLSAAGVADARADGLKRAMERLSIVSREGLRDPCCALARLYMTDATESDAVQVVGQCVGIARVVLQDADALRREVEKMEGAGYGRR